jgi:ribosomal protein L11 methyltransferase
VKGSANLMPTYWLELSVTAEPEAVEAISEVMSRYASGGVAIEEPYTLLDDGQVAQPLPEARVTIRVYVPDDSAGAKVRSRIEEGVWHLRQIGFGDIGEITTRRLAEEDWANAWKEFYQVSHLGQRTVIKPSWRDYQPSKPDEVVVELDPGMAFGTGLHPTTHACILALEQALHPGDRVLDVGCGSGILSLAAIKLGASSVLALDISSVAVEATRANAIANKIIDQIDVRLATLEGADGEPFSPLSPEVVRLGQEIGSYDVVLANIIARVIAQLAPSLLRATRPGGRLIASGIIAERRHEAEEPLQHAGLIDIQELTFGDWVTLIGKRAD